jgi:hypothetical protein
VEKWEENRTALDGVNGEEAQERDNILHGGATALAEDITNNAMDVDAAGSSTREPSDDSDSDDDSDDSSDVAMVPMADILNARYGCENVSPSPDLGPKFLRTLNVLFVPVEALP